MSGWAAPKASWRSRRRWSISAPRRNRTRVYAALGAARAAAKSTGSLMPPAHILNAPTRLMKHLGYGAGYAYDHATEDAFSGQNYFPDGMQRAELLPPDGPRLRARDRQAPGPLGRTARGARRVSVQTRTVTEDEADIRLDRWFRRHFPASPRARSRNCAAPARSAWTASAPRRPRGSPRARPCACRRCPRRPRRHPAPSCGSTPQALARAAKAWCSIATSTSSCSTSRTACRCRAARASPAISTACWTACASARGRPRLVHRLDRDTSGVLVLARTPGTAAKLAAAFRGRDVEKTYWAVVAGRPVPVEGRIDLRWCASAGPAASAPLPADRDDTEAARAITDYRTLDNAGAEARLAGTAAADRAHPPAPRALRGDRRADPGRRQIRGAGPERRRLRAGGGPVRSAAFARPRAAPAASRGRNGAGRGRLPPHMRETFQTLGFRAPRPRARRCVRADREGGYRGHGGSEDRGVAGGLLRVVLVVIAVIVLVPLAGLAVFALTFDPDSAQAAHRAGGEAARPAGTRAERAASRSMVAAGRPWRRVTWRSPTSRAGRVRRW